MKATGEWSSTAENPPVEQGKGWEAGAHHGIACDREAAGSAAAGKLAPSTRLRRKTTFRCWGKANQAGNSLTRGQALSAYQSEKAGKGQCAEQGTRSAKFAVVRSKTGCE